MAFFCFFVFLFWLLLHFSVVSFKDLTGSQLTCELEAAMSFEPLVLNFYCVSRLLLYRMRVSFPLFSCLTSCFLTSAEHYCLDCFAHAHKFHPLNLPLKHENTNACHQVSTVVFASFLAIVLALFCSRYTQIPSHQHQLIALLQR